MDGIVYFGIILFLSTTGWVLYKLNVMRKIRKSMREKATIEEVALLVRLRNAALAVLSYSLSCVCFLSFSLTRLSEKEAQYQIRLHAIEFLTGICIAAAGLGITCFVLQRTANARLKERVKLRASLQIWTARFWQSMEKVRRRNLVRRD